MVAFMLSLLWVADAGKFTLNWLKKITELNNLLPLGYFRLKLAETTYNAVLLNNGWTPFQQPPKLCVLRTHRRNITVFEGCRFCSLIFRILASKFRKLLGHFLRYLYFFIFFFFADWLSLHTYWMNTVTEHLTFENAFKRETLWRRHFPILDWRDERWMFLCHFAFFTACIIPS